MENKESNINLGLEAFHEEQEDDVLSLCNLTVQEFESSNDSSDFSSPREFFQFSSTLHNNVDEEDDERYFSTPEIIFCGKIIQQEQKQQLNENQKRDYLNLVRKPEVKAQEDPAPPRTAAKVVSGSSYQQRDRKVNMTALTSMSAKSRRRMFMFGPVKFKPEMDLSAIKERKGKRLTTLLSPEMMWDGGDAVVRDVSAAAAVEGGKRSQWGIVKATLKGRAHLCNVLARSFIFGCIPAASAGRNWVHVAN